MRRPPSPRTFTSPRTVSGTLLGAAAPAVTGAAISKPLAVPLFFFGAVTCYGLITSSPRWAPHCPYCDGKKRMGRAHCDGCHRRFSAR
jgi:hypothetical protein